ncbi:general transcription factor 3C polypeptide 2 [Siniperca chuatsi]|uniref:general transcription factor 3C polypeptide 2 n=1 Tax=Siniperca chuatsi TaxID=119488 RepID=UPI001CE17703|nr:general transcription factor 3C polypeptide 2 [Siniperca chuatsi]XP_044024945.1 general transcription factor 3C polypeptide 2 [Siniperca chuatsi]
MDPIDSGQGQEKPSEQHCDLTPSSRGRQRKKNSKYFDYETDDTLNVQSVQQRPPRKSSGGGGAASKKTPAKSGKAENATQQTADGEKEATDKTPQESDGKISEETPKRAVRAKKTPTKKTPVKKTPARKTPTTDVGLPTGEGGVLDTVQQENGTPKPKRKYVRKQPAQEVEPVTEPPCKEKGEGEPPIEPEEEIQPGGRRRRGAAKAALKYLHILAKEVLGHPNDESGANSDITRTEPDPVTGRKSLKGSKGRKGQKRKRLDYDSDPAEDEDFIPDVEDEEVEEMEDEEEEAEDSDSDSDLGTGGTFHVNRAYTGPNVKTPNRLNTNIMRTVWESTETTKKFREEHFSSWVFPEWVPSTSDWHPVPQSDLEKYLPQELQSAAFKVSREGLSKEETPQQRLSRFAATPAHPDRWDMLLYAGGPVWPMEWCPTPDGAPASQYIALASHRGMDDRHFVNKTYTGPGLVQLWDVGKLEYNSRPDSQPALAYGLAQDKGFIWQLKWCPAGGWEPPSCDRKAPFLPRLGLLAVASSSSVVTIYSLPHPDALHSNKKLANSGKATQQLPIYQAEGVLTLKLGSFKAPRHERSGQVLSMDWLPEKPHNIMAIGFYDGVVGLWDLSTKSALLRVRLPDASLSLLPYRCFLAHNHAVRALAFCPASRYLLVTAGEDRYVKTWDLRRLYDPITVLKRNLTNEIYWPLNAPGLLLAQENAYAANGSHGVHYFDHNMRAYFTIPRTGTLWSISYTDWLNSVVTSDSLGEVILALLPQICYSPQYVKRTLERRFPIYLTSLVPHDATKEENQEMGGVEEEGDAVEEQEGGDTEGPDAGSEGGNENDNENTRDGGRRRKDKTPPLQFQTYKEAVKKYCLHLTDNNMLTFTGSEKRAVWKRMKDTELKTKINMDEMPLAALHKVRFNPNMCCHTWVVSGGQTGLVRLHCLRSMISSQAKKMISENQAQFNALYSPKDQKEAVQTVSDEL